MQCKFCIYLLDKSFEGQGHSSLGYVGHVGPGGQGGQGGHSGQGGQDGLGGQSDQGLKCFKSLFVSKFYSGQSCEMSYFLHR